ncbi:MAG: roadblock/LC7 domain-containing protein [Candidatus Hermodarchaeia archaeon]|jgi:predicted regulator of Ras-like GTPase activity (Roadblock/LC7/MglB family)
MARTTVHDENHEEILREIITELEQHRDIKGWAIISQEGLLIEHRMPADVNPHLLAGNAAALAHSAQVVVGQTDSGPMKQVFLDGEQHFLIIVGGEEQLIFLVMADQKTDFRPLGEFLSTSARRFQS